MRRKYDLLHKTRTTALKASRRLVSIEMSFASIMMKWPEEKKEVGSGAFVDNSFCVALSSCLVLLVTTEDGFASIAHNSG